MATRFLLLMPWGRVGSSVLVSILRQTKGLKISAEYLIRLKTAEEQLNWLKEFYEISLPGPPHTFIGTKQSLRSICDFEEIKAFISTYNLRVVRLRRDNFVKSAVSQMRAVEYTRVAEQESRKAAWYIESGSNPVAPIHIEPELLLKRIVLMEENQRRLMEAFSAEEVLDIEYEEILRDINAVVVSLRGHIGLPDAPYNIPHEKFTPDDLKAAIINYSEVTERLSGTPYQAML